MRGGGTAPDALSLGEAVERLRAPDACERFSPLTGERLLVVDFQRDATRLPVDASAAARAALASIPAPSVALCDGPVAPAAQALRDAFDVVLEEASGLDALAARVAEHPLAATALVQLLRHGEGQDMEAGLVRESMVYGMLQAGPEFAAWLAGREAKPPPLHAAPPVKIRRELDRLHLRLDHPQKCNAFSAEMRDLLCEGLSLALADDSIEEVILSGEGAAFCSGGDLDEFGSLPDPATAHAIRSTRSVARLLARCAPRLHARVHGACVGAGVELPAFAARVSVLGDAFFELPELGMGLVPGAGGTVSLPRRIGRQRTAWLALSGQRIDTATALAWGLVDEVRPDAEGA